MASCTIGLRPWLFSVVEIEALCSTRSSSTLHSPRKLARVRALSGDHLPRSHRAKALREQLRKAAYTSERSSILVIGLSVRTATVELREKLAILEAEWEWAAGELVAHNHIEEAAILSTCNRIEIYVVALSWRRGVKEVTEWMSKMSGLPLEELWKHLFILRDQDATRHLCKVSAGLDSLVLGEGQILAQVKQVAKHIAKVANGSCRTLNDLFKRAVAAGKRVRAETSISAGAVSVSSAAVELAAAKVAGYAGLSAARVMIVGAGKMSKLLVKHLISKSCTEMTIVNRSEQRVIELQAEFPEAELQYQPLDEMMRCAGEADVVFTSTASDQPLFSKGEAGELRSAPLGIRLIIDISVPRNVAACIAEVPGVKLYNVDDLKEVVAGNLEERKREAVKALSIVEQEVDEFERLRDSLQTVSTVKKLKARAEEILACEVQRCFRKMAPEDLSPKTKKLIEDMARAIINKLLHGPMRSLRCEGSDARSVDETLDNMHALERMFDLNDEQG